MTPKKTLGTSKKALGLIVFLASFTTVHAMPPFTGDNFSGVYVCKGNNLSVGDYEVRVTLKLNEVTSHDIYGVYDFSTESNNQATYVGQIMAKKHHFAMTFKLLNAPENIYSTGMGEFKKTGYRLWSFNTTYYEPDGNGGNFGRDQCKMVQPPSLLQGKSAKDTIKQQKQPS